MSIAGNFKTILKTKGYKAYDSFKNREQADRIKDSLEGKSFHNVRVMKTTFEANPEIYPFVIYVNHKIK